MLSNALLILALQLQSQASPPSQPEGFPDSLCWLDVSRVRHCETGAAFAARVRIDPADETLSASAIREFQRDSLPFEFAGSGFDQLVVQAFRNAGYQPDPRNARGEHVVTLFRASPGPRRLLWQWQRRTKLVALISRDIYRPRSYRVLFAGDVEESPNGREWQKVPEQVDPAIVDVVGHLNQIVERSRRR